MPFNRIPVLLSSRWPGSRSGRLLALGMALVFLPVHLPAVADAAEDGMLFPGEAWLLVEPRQQHVDPDKLAAAIAFLEQNSGRDGVGELVLVRHGRIIWQGDNIDKVHGIWSCTKSFTSTALGLLVDDGKCTLDSRARDIVPEMRRAYPQVTLRHFTTMTSGYRASGDTTTGSYKHGPSKTPFAIDPQPLFLPGTQYAYWDSAMNQFARLLTKIAGKPLVELFGERIADPIGIDPKAWRWGDFGEVDGIKVNGGAGNNSKHVQISARQLARFGHLMLNRGRWNGRQLLSRQWCIAATSTQVPATVKENHRFSGADGRGVYGYNWWTNGFRPDGERKWPAAPVGTFAASGYNNNDMFIIPEWGMVIVRLGLDQSDQQMTDETYSKFIGMVGEALSSI